MGINASATTVLAGHATRVNRLPVTSGQAAEIRSSTIDGLCQLDVSQNRHRGIVDLMTIKMVIRADKDHDDDVK